MPDNPTSDEFKEKYQQCLSVLETIEEQPDYAKLYKKLLSARLSKAKERSVAKSVPFDLDFEWAFSQITRQKYLCALTNIPFELEHDTSGSMNPYAPSFDRIEPRIGYTKENVRIVCTAANIMLSDWGIGVVKDIAKRL